MIRKQQTRAAIATRTLVLASGNPGKLKELTDLLAPAGWQVRPQSEWSIEEAVEDGETFLENALIKARHAAKCCNLAALGDDSGLVVDALGGRPGIYSSRFAGEGASDADNNAHLLAALAGVPEDQRTAHFYCVMVMLRHAGDPAPIVSTGRWEGRIVSEARGTHGFGYDPLFWVPSENCTSAELPAGRKNRLSHRALALDGLLAQVGPPI